MAGLAERRGELFVGRRTERQVVSRILAASRRGRSEVLIVRGEAGIGKTALLRYAIGRAGAMRVLSARGVASESAIPFAGLSELLRPPLDQIDRLPGRQSSALAGALAIGPPSHADRFAVSVATLNLLSLAAESESVLVAVDDLHWLDPASAEALLFAARRLNGEPVAGLFTLREGEALSVDVSGIPELVLDGLDAEASLALLEAHAGEIAREVAEQLVVETAGNPLALIETPTLLSEEQRSGSESLERPLPAGVGIARAYARRLGALPSATRTALLVAAVGDSSRIEPILDAMERLEVDPSALEPAEAEGLITVGDLRLEFRHPLLRSSVCSVCSPAERRAAHRALAAAHENAAAEDALERRAWHLSAAAVGVDGEAADLLAQAGARACERHGYVAAAQAYERAARLSVRPEDRARRLLAAAEARQIANCPPEAIALLDEAESLAREPDVCMRIHHLRAKIDTWRGPATTAYELLIADAEAIRGVAPDEAASMSADAVLCAIVSGDIRLAVSAARRAYEFARGLGGRAELVAGLQLGKALVLSGESRSGHPLVMRYEELITDGNLLAHAEEIAPCAPALMTVEEFSATERLLADVIGAARQTDALGLLPYCLGALGELDVRLGRWQAAYANGLASVDLAREAGQEGQLSYNLARLARLEAAQGRQEACKAHTEEALALAEGLRFGSTFPFAHSARGLLELGLREPGEAIRHLEETRRWTDDVMGMLEPTRLEWMPDLVEAYVHCGRSERALELIGDLERRAERSFATWPKAVAARCRGLVAGDGEFTEHFESALRWHARTPTPFERARTELCLGERLRRARRRGDAREPLRAAFEVFEQLGAVPWASRARAELAATGQTVRSRQIRFSDELTARELQVALVVAQGATNREAASALFLTPKTVEYHLAHIYRKLGVRSRTELARRIGDDTSAASRALLSGDPAGGARRGARGAPHRSPVFRLEIAASHQVADGGKRRLKLS
jgi:DNA-binding CsgD family transcriptional regulator